MLLHYIYDPLCGWCYGSAPRLAAAEQEGFEIVLHAGGMMMGPNRQPASAIRQFVLTHDARMSQMTGQPIGAAYRDVFLNDPTAMFDSEPPIVAILAAEESGLRMLDRIQRARFLKGLHIARPEVLRELAEELQIPNFDAAYDRWNGAKTYEHIEASRALLREVGGQGFPTYVLEKDGNLRTLDSATYLGRVEAWRAMLKTLA